MYEGSMEAFKRIRIYSDSPLVNKEHPEPQLPPLSLERAASLPLPSPPPLPHNPPCDDEDDRDSDYERMNHFLHSMHLERETRRNSVGCSMETRRNSVG